MDKLDGMDFEKLNSDEKMLIGFLIVGAGIPAIAGMKCTKAALNVVLPGKTGALIHMGKSVISLFMGVSIVKQIAADRVLNTIFTECIENEPFKYPMLYDMIHKPSSKKYTYEKGGKYPWGDGEEPIRTEKEYKEYVKRHEAKEESVDESAAESTGEA